MSLTSVNSDATATPPSMLPEVAEVVSLFSAGGPLSEVEFPEVGRDAFETLTATLKTRQQSLEELRAAVAQARQALAEVETTLMQRAETALAYARVYAGADDELRAHLDGLLMARRQAKASRPKRRRKKSASDPTGGGAKVVGELPLIAVG